MNNSGYIVNPIWFWLISIVNNLGIAAIMVAGLLIFIGIILIAVIISCYTEDQYEEMKKFKPHFIKINVVFVIAVTIAVLTPSRQDMEKIIVFSTLTKDNITAATNYGKDLVDYVFDKINNDDNETEERVNK